MSRALLDAQPWIALVRTRGHQIRNPDLSPVKVWQTPSGGVSIDSYTLGEVSYDWVEEGTYLVDLDTENNITVIASSTPGGGGVSTSSSGVTWFSDVGAPSNAGGIDLGANLPARLPESSGARIFYVDAATGNDANTGLSEAAAWAGLQDYFSGTAGPANNTAPLPGDIVKVKNYPGQVANGFASVGYRPGGSFDDHVIDNKSGSALDPITVEAFPGHQPIILGPAIAPRNPKSRCLRVRGGSKYWRFRGLKFPYSAGEDLPEGNEPCIYLTGATTGNLEFYGCDISGATDGSGVLGELRCFDVQFINCIAHDIADVRFTEDALQSAQSHGWYLNDTLRWALINCIVVDIANGYGFQNRNGADDTLVTNCLGVRIKGPGAEFAAFMNEPASAGTDRQTVVNSIAYDVKRGVRALSGTGQTGCRAYRVDVFLASVGAYGNALPGSGFDFSAGGTGDFVGPGDNQTVDPLFVNPAANDFHLQAGSPVRGDGIPELTPPYDYYGNTRTQATLGPIRSAEEIAGPNFGVVGDWYLDELTGDIYEKTSLSVWTLRYGQSTLPMLLVEQGVDPAAPAVNGAKLYTRDNGAGKTQLCIRYAAGAVQVISTQP